MIRLGCEGRSDRAVLQSRCPQSELFLPGLKRLPTAVLEFRADAGVGLESDLAAWKDVELVRTVDMKNSGRVSRMGDERKTIEADHGRLVRELVLIWLAAGIRYALARANGR